jgi:hypothetical protein
MTGGDAAVDPIGRGEALARELHLIGAQDSRYLQQHRLDI